jgi:5-methylcytosine-specific restriction endonuclease McrA
MKDVKPKRPRVKLATNDYERLRQRVLRRDCWRCQNCGSLRNLEVHHNTFRSRSGDDSEFNLMEASGKIFMMSTYADPPWKNREIPDPYFGSEESTHLC